MEEAVEEEAPLLDNAVSVDKSSMATQMKPQSGGVQADCEEEIVEDDAFPANGANRFTYEEYYNTEEYNEIIENGYKSVAANPLSTFSVDVDTASYANVRRMIEYGEYINPDAVRIEEFINYFDYDYSEPTTSDPFSVNVEMSDCPWNEEAKLMLVGLKAEDIKKSDREPLNLVFLIDVSGSMFSEDKLPLVQKAFTMLTETLTEDDRISIVTYAGDERVVLKGTSGEDKDKIIDAINSLEAGGSTYGEAGINRAYDLADKYFIDGGNNRVILATDGDLNVGLSSEEELTELIEEKRESGVFLSVLGFGTGNVKDDRMEALADHGNGNYSYIDSEMEAKKVLVEEMTGTLYTVAKDVKIQVEFNPVNVSGYRLIGYENRALADKDFHDDTKGAGEIGAGHTVTALYEIVLNENGTSIPEAELKYQQNTSTGNKDELLTVSLRYKEPDEDESKLLAVPVTDEVYTKKMPENLTFAAAVAEFGMVLRNSEFKGTASCDQILELLEDYDYRSDDYKTEFVYLVRTMDKRGY
ncbi:MAG: VWA domain-containing protein [Oscillospiraceae bacterium]|nr:VWA domain-containing protein [Oscillospiraceae bacterium]